MTSKSFFKYFLRSQICLLLLFTAGRIIFLLWHSDHLPAESLSLIPGVMMGGLWLDIMAVSVIGGSCYIVSRIFFFTSDLFRKSVFNLLFRFALFLSCLVLFSDLFYYDQFGTRLNVMAMNIARDPGPILSTILHSFPIVPVSLAGILITVLYYLISRNWSIQITRKDKTRQGWSSLILLLCGTGSFLYLPEPAWTYLPGTSSSFLGQSALNGFYSFSRSVLDQGLGEKDIPVYSYGPDAVAFSETGKWIGAGISFATGVNSPFVRMQSGDTGQQRPDVVIIIVESFGNNLIGKSVNGQALTPRFDQWKNKGLFFNDFYSNGPRTQHGVISTLSGFPAVLGGNLARRKGTKVFQTLADVMKSKGYKSSFYHNGNPAYDDLDFILEHSFDNIRGKKDLTIIQFENEWGACDEDLYRYVLGEWQKDTLHPKLSVLLTVSNHLPYDIPPAFNFAHPELRKLTKMEQGMYYTDRVLGDFLDSCQRRGMMKNTFFFILGDHAEMYRNPDSDVGIFHIPLLVLGPGIEPGISDKTASQTDLAASVAGLPGGGAIHHFIGQSVFSPGKGFAVCKGYLNDVILKMDTVITRFSFTTEKAEHFAVLPDRSLKKPVKIHPEEELKRIKFLKAYMQTASSVFRNGRHRFR
ncbi:MAG: sulfatase-like hydrolase/transferase [Bacteroidia bacterium]|nr:sulfatase-like hydrolase/transferase [Bacteroidia bacterium]